MASRDNFDYSAYAEFSGYTNLPEGSLETQGAKDLLYREATTRAYDDYRKQNGLGNSQADKYKTVTALEEVMPDARWALDLPAERSQEEQLQLLKPPAFAEYLRDVGARDDEDLADYRKNYAGVLMDEWANPHLTNKLQKNNVLNRLATRTEDYDTVGDVYKATAPKPVPTAAVGGVPTTPADADEDPSLVREWLTPHLNIAESALGALKGAYTIATSDDVASSFKRSQFSDKAAAAAQTLFDPTTTYLTGEFDTEEAPLDPALVEAERVEAAAEMALNINEKAKIPISPNLMRLMQSPDWGTAIENADVESISALVAEGGMDMIQELGAAIGGGVVGSFMGPAGTVTGAAAGAGVAANENAYANHFATEAEDELRVRKLPVTAENLIMLSNDTEWVSKVKGEAAQIGQITGAGAVVSTAAGGLINAQALKSLSNLTRRAASEIAYRAPTAAAQVGAATVAGATSAGVDIASEFAAKAVTGEAMTPGEQIAVGAMGLLGGAVDVGTGAIAGTRASGEPIEIKKGATYYTPEVDKLTVVDGNVHGEIELADADGQPVFMTADQVQGLSSLRPYPVYTPTLEQAASTRQTPPPEAPDTDTMTGYSLIGMHINRLSDRMEFPDNYWEAIDAELGDQSLAGIASTIGRAVTPDRKDANSLLIRAFESSGAIQNTPERGFVPADPENPVQLNMAAIANSARIESELTAPPAKPVAPEVLPDQAVIEYIGATRDKTISPKKLAAATDITEDAAEVALQQLEFAGFLGQPNRSGNRPITGDVRSLVGRDDLRQPTATETTATETTATETTATEPTATEPTATEPTATEPTAVDRVREHVVQNQSATKASIVRTLGLKAAEAETALAQLETEGVVSAKDGGGRRKFIGVADEFVPEDAYVPPKVLPEDATVTIGEDVVPVTLTDQGQYVDDEGTFYTPERVLADAKPVQPKVTPVPQNTLANVPRDERKDYMAAVGKVLSPDESSVWKAATDVDKDYTPDQLAGLTDTGLQKLAADIQSTTTVKKLRSATLDSIVKVLENIKRVHEVAPDTYLLGRDNTPFDIKATRDKHTAAVADLDTKELKAELEAADVLIGKLTGDKLKAAVAQLRTSEELLATFPNGHGTKKGNAAINRVHNALTLKKNTPKRSVTYQAVAVDRTAVPKAKLEGRAPAPTKMSVEVLAEAGDKPQTIVLDGVKNFITQAYIERIEGYVVTPHLDANNNVVAMTLTRDGRKQVHVISKGDPREGASKDRAFKVFEGGNYDSKKNKVVRGVERPSMGGNKHFTIPGRMTAIFKVGDVADQEQGITKNGIPGTRVGEVKLIEGFPSITLERDGESALTFQFLDTQGNVVVTSEGGVTVRGTPEAPVGLGTIEAETAGQKAIKEANRDIDDLRDMNADVKPKTPTAIERTDDAIDRRMEHLDQPYDYETVEGQTTVATGGGITVKIDHGELNVDEVRRGAEAYSYATNEAQVMTDIGESGTMPFARGNMDYTVSDVQALVDRIFPEHIASIINLDDSPNNPAAQMDAWGFFAFDYTGNGPEIHIDMQPGVRDLHSVLSTISEEVAHFSFNSWTTGRSRVLMQKFYDKAWAEFGGDAIQNLPEYMARYDIDPDNPTPAQQYTLLNELFSKQGTSMMDFTDTKIDPPAGMTREQVNNVRDEAVAAFDGFTIDMGQLDGLDAKELATMILSAQTRAIRSRHSVFEYKDGNDVLTVRPTPFGSHRSFHGDTPESIAWRDMQDNLENMRGAEKDTAGHAAYVTKRWLMRNRIRGNRHIGRKAQRIVSSNSRIDEAATNKQYREGLVDSLRAQSMLEEEGLSPTITGSYVETFLKAGFGGKAKRMALARGLDARRELMKNVPFELAEDIRQAGIRHIETLRTLGESGGVPENTLGGFMATIETSLKRFKGHGYEHTRYKAYTDPSQKKIFVEMLQFLRGKDQGDKGNLLQQYTDATEALKGPTLTKQQRQRHEQTADKYIRLKALHDAYMHKFNKPSKLGQDINDQVLKAMTGRLRGLLGDPDDGSVGNKATSGSMSDVSRKMKLDHTAPAESYDQHMITFLKEVTDPIEVLIHTAAKQKDVLRQMESDLALVEAAYEVGGHGAVWVKGSANTESPSGVSSRFTDEQHRGSIVEFVEYHEVFGSEVNRSIEIQSMIDRSLTNQLISWMKTSKTVWSINTLMNWASVPYLLTVHGHIFRAPTVVKSMGAVGEAWRQRTDVPTQTNMETYVQQIVRELKSKDGLGTGLEIAVLDIVNNQQAVQSIARALVKTAQLSALPDAVRLSGEAGTNTIAKVDRMVTLMQDFYAFPDEVPKLLTYMVNRNLMEKKYRAEMKRADYVSDDVYEKAVNSKIVDAAVDRTRREQSDYAAIPEAIKKLGHTQLRVITPTFLMHQFQIARIAREAVGLMGEDLAEYNTAKAAGHVEYAVELQVALAARTVGLMASVGERALFWWAGITGANIAFNTLVNAAKDLLEDDDDKWEHVATVAQTNSMSAGVMYGKYMDTAKYEPLAIKQDRYVWTLSQSTRHNPMESMMMPPITSTDIDRGEQVFRTFRNSFVPGEEGMYLQFANAISGIDYKGDKIETLGGHFTNAIRTTTNMMTPGFFRDAYEAVAEENSVSGKFTPRSDKVLTYLTGTRKKSLDVRDLMGDVGRMIKRDMSGREHTRVMIDDLARGNKSYDTQMLVKMIMRDREANLKLMNKYAGFTGAMYGAGYTNKEIVEYMSSDRRPGNKNSKLSEKNAKLIYRAKNVFDAGTEKRIQTAIGRVEGKPVDGVLWTQEFKDRATDNLNMALKEYRRQLKKK